MINISVTKQNNLVNDPKILFSYDGHILTNKDTFALISIRTPGAELSEQYPNKYAMVLNLEFTDYDLIMEYDVPENIRINSFYHMNKNGILFSEKHIKSIEKFVQEIKEFNISNLLIQCEAGVSRSPAIALALYQATKWEYRIGDSVINRFKHGYNQYVFNKLYQSLTKDTMNGIKRILEKNANRG